MEEYYQPSETSFVQDKLFNIQCQPIHIQHQMVNSRHFSMFGMKLQKKVVPFQRNHCSTIVQHLNIESLSSEAIFKNVYSFLNSLITDSKLQSELTQVFKIVHSEKDSSANQSQGSINSIGSNNFSHQNILWNIGSNRHQKLKQISNNSCELNLKVPKQLVKVRPSLMRKSNRISIADGIKISELQECLKEITPLLQMDSSSSINQDVQFFQFKSKRQLKFQSDNSVDNLVIKLNGLDMHQEKGREKKMSIMIMMENYDDKFSSDSFFSEEQTISLTELVPKDLPFTLEIMQIIFDAPQPYLINLSLCLLLKCVSVGQLTLTYQNTSWMLSIAYIAASKIYYDQPLQGIIDCFSQIIGITRDNVIHLERWFLQRLNYEVSINAHEYQQIMFHLINQP